MREVRIYQPGHYKIGDELLLTEEAGHHVNVVLRMQVGEKLRLFAGNNYEFLAQIITINKKKIGVLLLESWPMNRESPLNIHLGQAISKGDKMEWVVQKAVELGVGAITPLFTERCVVKFDNERLQKKRQQWQNIAIAACEQCGRNKVPLVHYPINLSEFLKQEHPPSRFVLNPQSENTWRNFQANAEIVLIIGPEGGFTEDELKKATHEHFTSLTLGPRILRTETAAIVALGVLQAAWGDL